MSNPNVISKRDGKTYIPVVIIGAGESGIAMGCRLKQVLGFDQFRIFDRQGGIGGTWWINTYPGIACDIPAPFYSFSFAPNYTWTTYHPGGDEILRYLHGVCEKFKIVDKIQLDTEVLAARWLEEEELWEVTTTQLAPGVGDLSSAALERKRESGGKIIVKREIIRCKILISGVGGLVEPNSLPKSIPGWETFEGKVFHSARWDHDVDFNDKNVVVVGTGCSAVQLVPRLIREPFNAKSVTQLMRTPPWLIPPRQPPFGRENWARWAPAVFTSVPALGWIFRQLVAAVAEYDWRLFGGSDYNERERIKLQERVLAHVYKSVPEKYHEILTPNYSIGCKRRVLDTEWSASLHDPRIELTTLKFSSVQAHGVTLGPSVGHPLMSTNNAKLSVAADVIVLANGFDTTQWLHHLDVIGKNGVSLHNEWGKRGGPQAYNGTSMDGFPNFFIIIGPNTVTGHSSVILATECMINYSLNFIKPILRGDVSQVEVKREAEEGYTKDIQEQMKNKVWTKGNCNSWYKDESGWNSTVYPYSQVRFVWRSMFPIYADWNFKYTPKGRRKRRLRRIAMATIPVATVVGIYQARQAGYLTLGDIQSTLQNCLRRAIEMVGGHVAT